ncbi:GIY-YIG nuclease family protein [Methylobrevis albus]|uniref:GIY-YIG nuclease family protein n=1 Tax=Methylobrevis albus TaxID=2793297 RepID=A0A931HZI9_9HYPH|nr:GIY-YIG nuclease family protein [Methylobrevis albus]MBH0236553.1 GIY-YIG nuclease family protein [Methylobrevis albus]
MLASGRNGTIYIGVTSDLLKRVYDHRCGAVPGFTGRYAVKDLVWFEQHQTMDAAILREKQLKTWRRAWKIELIEASNPDWIDLFDGIAR